MAQGQPRFGFGKPGTPGGESTDHRSQSFLDPSYFTPFKEPLAGFQFVRPGSPRTAAQRAAACRVVPQPSRSPIGG